jgi:transcriptional regulator with XRE-family HTH domain
MMLMTEPNTRLRAVRRAMRLTQAELARAVREAGERSGEPNACSGGQVQRWEAGTSVPYPRYVRALELATGQPAENLGLRADEKYGLDPVALGLAGRPVPDTSTRAGTAPLTGIWLSRYEYESSGRGAWFASSHYVLLLQQGAHLEVRGLPHTAAGRLFMDMSVNGATVTGTWTEETNPGGYYQGAVYYGAIQMLLEPSGRRMAGKWAGFGREYEVNTGPWSLELVTADTSPESIEKYDRPVEDGDRALETAGPATSQASRSASN